MSLQEQQQLEAQYVMPTYARQPVEFVHGKGMKVFDSTGKEYLDFIAGIGVVSLGHCHPALVQTIADQASRLMHVGNYYYTENRGEVAEMLSDLLAEVPSSKSSRTTRQAEGGTHAFSEKLPKEAPKIPWKTFFANSGAEANECALKLARLWGKKQGKKEPLVVTLEGSFHGRTLATLAATAQPEKQKVFQPLPAGFVAAPLNDSAFLEALFKEKGDAICAVMLECIQGESGIHPCDATFLKTAEALAHAHGALLICDEVQSGIYRCGTYPFAFQHYDISPDVVTIAKGVASGFPVGMCAAQERVASTFSPGDHGSTFGGSCLALAATKTTLETLKELNSAQEVEQIGAYLRERLQTLPCVSEVRGKGLMTACDLNGKLSAPEVVNRALEQGLLINATGPQTLRFLPPLVCTKKDIDILCEKLIRIMQ